MTTILLNSLAIVFAVSTACNSGETSKASDGEHENHGEMTTAAESGNPQFKDEKAKSVYQHYIHLKSALVKSDVKEAKAGAEALNKAFSNAGNVKGAALAGKIAASADLKAQRNDFDVLSAEVEAFIRKAGLKSGKVYKQYCPMAKSGDGAYWLASESEVNNPYYGDEMLHCGEVTEEIK